MPTENSITNTHQSESKIVRLWRMGRGLLFAASMLGLGSFNVLTLVNDNIHAAGFNFLKAILAPVVAEATLSRLLNHSPMQKYSVLEQSHKTIEAKHVELKRISETRSGIVKKVSTRIGKRAVANALKNVSSLAVEVVPVVGVTAIVALTASDIYDDCQTLIDLNELNINFDHEKNDEATVCGMKVPAL